MILSDKQIKELCTGDNPMLSPFVNTQVRYGGGQLILPTPERQKALHDPKWMEQELESFRVSPVKLLSYGVSSYGYDARLARKIYLFTNHNAAIIDPRKFSEDVYVDAKILTDEDGLDYFILPPNSYALGYTTEYFKMPRDVTAICLGKSTYARCFTGDTRVALADGTSPTFLELIERNKSGERFFGYSVSDENKIVMGELTAPRKIGHEKIITVTLDDGTTIRATPDHKFITLDGQEIEARNLTEGTRLMPLYRNVSRGYEQVIQPMSWSFESTHRLADNWNVRNNVYSPGENEHRHHIDGNKRNNYPFNIERVASGEHIREHNLERMKNPEWVAKFKQSHVESFAKHAEDPDWLAARLDNLKKATQKFWSFEEDHPSKHQLREKRKQYWKSEKGLEYKEILRQRTRAMFANAAFMEEHRERLNALWKDPDFREIMAKQCGELNVRKDIDEEAVKNALETAGSIRGAARLLNCDKTVFRRFKDIVIDFKEKLIAKRITAEQFMDALRKHGSGVQACKALGVGRSFGKRHFSDVLSEYYGSRIASNHKVVSVVDHGQTEDVYCLTAPEFGNFALDAGVFVNNCAVSINATPIEAGWEGNVVLELANMCGLPIKVYIDQGIAQFLFFRGDTCDVSYADRGGKYQGQTGLTLPKV